jgi:HrpA-like RNA helicase
LLEAIDKDGRIRTLGHELAKFPVEPSFAKGLLASCYVSRRCTEDFAKLLAVLSTENVWMAPTKLDEERQRNFYRAK